MAERRLQWSSLEEAEAAEGEELMADYGEFDSDGGEAARMSECHKLSLGSC